jgi:hypothetical protein
MKTLPLAALTLVAGVAFADQDKSETREVRIYLLDRTAPDRDYKDAAAVLTIERPTTGKGRTFLFPRVAKGIPTPGEDRATGMIRCLPGTPYFVELQTGEGAPAAKPEAAPEKEKVKGKEGAPLSGTEVLKRVHARGAYFVQKVPADLLTGTYTATITLRVGSQTYTSEEFQGPRPENVTLDDVAAKVDQSLAGLKTKAEEQTGFMDLKPAVTQLRRELAQLAPAGFEDGTGAFELDRQWCLTLARNIDEACDRGNTARVLELSQQCGPRLKNMQTMLAGTKKEPEPETEIPVK